MKKQSLIIILLLVSTLIVTGCSSGSKGNKGGNGKYEVDFEVDDWFSQDKGTEAERDTSDTKQDETKEVISEEVTEDTTESTTNAAVFEEGKIVSHDDIMAYMSEGYSSVVYAIKTGDEYQVLYCHLSNDENKLVWKLNDNQYLGTIPFVEVDIADGSQLVVFGDAYGAYLRHVPFYCYALPIFFSGRNLPYSFSLSTDTDYSFSKQYKNSILESDISIGEADGLDVSEVDGVPLSDSAIQSRILDFKYSRGGWDTPSLLLAEGDTIKLGGFIGTEFHELVFKSGYYIVTDTEEHYESDPTKEGYFVLLDESELGGLQAGETYLVGAGTSCLIKIKGADGN